MDVLQGLDHPGATPRPDGSGWQNLPVDPASLPAPEDGPSQGLSRLYLKVQTRRLYLAVLILTLAVLATTAWHRQGLFLMILAAPVLLLFLGGPWLRRHFLSCRYALRQRDITYRSGWLWHRITTLPYHRIQHAEIGQGMIEKWYGLATLEVFTAGKNASDLSIPGLQLEEAERLKTYILGRTAGAREEEE
jgi:uncharacterized protein